MGEFHRLISCRLGVSNKERIFDQIIDVIEGNLVDARQILKTRGGSPGRKTIMAVSTGGQPALTQGTSLTTIGASGGKVNMV